MLTHENTGNQHHKTQRMFIISESWPVPLTVSVFSTPPWAMAIHFLSLLISWCFLGIQEGDSQCKLLCLPGFFLIFLRLGGDGVCISSLFPVQTLM